ncbi:hypothetical protein EV401DRAFT_2080287 [Pisolithus croceorrhizus]|nr:hypothetical protein EV401DRAFT_2080287 [Pisolithus croceorrhizus]
MTLPANAPMHRIKNYGMFRALPIPTLLTAITFPSAGQYNPTAPAKVNRTPATVEQVTAQAGTTARVLGSDDQTVHKNTSEPTLLGQNTDNPLLFGIKLATSFMDQPQEQATGAFHVESKDPEAKKDDQGVTEQGVEIGEVHEQSTLEQSDDIFTRLTEKGLFYPPRVKKIVEMVNYGPLPPDLLDHAKRKVAEFADTFALPVCEVRPVTFHKFHLDVPKEVTFSTKVNQKPLAQSQKEFLFPVLDKFNVAGIIAPGLSIQEIWWMVEDQCISNGEAPDPSLPPRPAATPNGPPDMTIKLGKTKWRLCQNFSELNKVVTVPPMPQGNIKNQATATSRAQDWAQVPNRDLEVHTSDSEGTKQAKEAKKGRWEAIWKERQAKACRQRAEEAHLERECQEHKEQERWDHEECEEHEKVEAVQWAAAAEAEAMRQSVAKDKGRHDDQGLNQDDGGSPHIHGKAANNEVRKRKKKCSWAMTEDNEGTAGGSRKHAGMGGLWGSGKKKGQTGNEDNDDDDEIEEVPALVVPQFEVAHSRLVGEASESGELGQGVPERLYDEWMLVVQGRQAAAMELQALAVQTYVRHVTATLPWPPVGRVGVGAGRVETGTMGSRLGIEWSELEVAEEPEESGSEGNKDAEGEEDMQE